MKEITDVLERIFDKVDEVSKQQTEMMINQAVHAEKQEAQGAEIDGIKNDLEPIKEHVNRMSGGAKLVALMGIVATIAAAILMAVK